MNRTSTIDTTLWTVKDVMARLVIQRTKATQIIKQLPHIQMGRSLRVERYYVEEWIRQHYVSPGSVTKQPSPAKPKKRTQYPGMDENGKLLRKRKDGSFYAAKTRKATINT